MKSKPVKILVRIIILITAIYAILLIPDSAISPPISENKTPFAWNADQYWDELESEFANAKQLDCDSLNNSINLGLADFNSMIEESRYRPLNSNSSIYHLIEKQIFKLSVIIGACPERLEEFINLFLFLRTTIKGHSIMWNMKEQSLRDDLYRLLYGGRTAIEEVILQAPNTNLRTLFIENEEPSATPSAEMLGVRIHSGDILVSRGGAPTSALIARGNDYPGNFSHIAIVHVDEKSHEVSIIESHIEIGVAIADIEKYFNDKKLRVMILRPRSDLPEIQADPTLPHKAASYALDRAKNEHIAYDFAMDINDSHKLFCSEVASDAYAKYGLNLWSSLSHISSAGVRNWLSNFGVRNFVTQEPSDLEYDPQVTVVAEWRDYETLYKDHLDNAVVDIMLESADNGEEMDYNIWMLPIARIYKAYSWILNRFNEAGPIPEGMSATSALKNEWFSARHDATVEKLRIEANRFYQLNGYVPPYWELIKLARRAYNQ